MTDATRLLHDTALNTMRDEGPPVIRCAVDEQPSPSIASSVGMLSSPALSDPSFLTEGSRQVCADPPIWIFDGLISESVLLHVDSAFEGIEWQTMNGRQVRMVEFNVDDQLADLTCALRDISHIDDVSPCGKAWVMDVQGRNQGPHLDGWELEKNRDMQLLDLSRCSVQCHNGFNTIIPTLSMVIYFNDFGGIAFPHADLPNPTIPAKRGRIVMFQNYHDSCRPAHNPKAMHYGVYGNGAKRVMTAGVMSNETPLELSGARPVGVPKTRGFLYAPIMHRANTSCGNRTPPTPPTPKPAAPPKPKPILQLNVRAAVSGGFIVEATSLAGNVVAKASVEEDTTVRSLRDSLGVDAELVCGDQIINGASDAMMKDTVLFQSVIGAKAPKIQPPKPSLQLNARTAESGGFIVEATGLFGNVVTKALVKEDTTLRSLRDSLGVGAELLFCNDQIIRGAADTMIKDTILFHNVTASRNLQNERLASDEAPEQQCETLVEWDVIDTTFARKAPAQINARSALRSSEVCADSTSTPSLRAALRTHQVKYSL
jgi:hypothetical protein